MDGYEGFCAIKHHLGSTRVFLLGGLKPVTVYSEINSGNCLTLSMLHLKRYFISSENSKQTEYLYNMIRLFSDCINNLKIQKIIKKKHIHVYSDESLTWLSPCL